MRRALCLLGIISMLLLAACADSDTTAATEPAGSAESAASSSAPATTSPTTVASTAVPTTAGSQAPASTTTTPPSNSTSTSSTVVEDVAADGESEAADVVCRRIEDFDDSAGQRWGIVNDGVMGGQSEGGAGLEDGIVTFAGVIETDGGGFSSIRGLVESEDLADADRLVLRLRSDGRQYELLADDAVVGRDRRVTHYQSIAVTEPGEWAEVEVSLVDMEARVFGRTVTDVPFDPASATVIGVILSDGMDGPFLLEIDWIDACS